MVDQVKEIVNFSWNLLVARINFISANNEKKDDSELHFRRTPQKKTNFSWNQQLFFRVYSELASLFRFFFQRWTWNIRDCVEIVCYAEVMDFRQSYF